ncbi:MULTISPECIES: MetQ/NlpA family ABC transporter substrate-binding protein [unclassified Pseudomonas]|jgi:D-methionine transport system substrate-binding protein|uniref:MetQ/NlpA family ABC transporter substrate-binding protein n=1 Tax=unclassified Pseudomonas TaxID=196821 RepID=UPI001786C9C1|nr:MULTISPECIES: MetQ/NlpA family ABC transporter substrate-binding protein [unclassified Pseudomonas]MBD8707562.1 MetQ/NlpA family ABC transporter substrate-binding protein [Pseudomonas sp. CFBP 13711]MBD8713140.1 MetQ/NlpA family ABC transporter substrate-binding protein [Pseudomonas sp. CFBP 13715]
MTKTLLTLALSLGLFAGVTHAADQPLKVGTTAAFAIPLEAAVAEADKQGLKVELVEFTDWIAPNVSLNAGDIDVNYFQHIPFLENAKAASGFDLVPYAPGIINNVGLYSKKYKSFDELPTGATVAIANDPINSGRGLQLLAKAGLITLKPGVGYKATEDDITANPKKIKLIQVEAVQLVRAYDDADLVQGYPAYIRLSKTFDAGSAILFDGLDHPEYVIQFVIKPDHKDDPRLAKFIDIYQHSPVVRASLDKVNGSLYQVGWKN